MDKPDFSSRESILAFAFTKADKPGEAMALAEQITAFLRQDDNSKKPHVAPEPKSFAPEPVQFEPPPVSSTIQHPADVRRYTILNISHAQRLLNSGVPKKAIAKRLGVHHTTIYLAIKDGRLKARPGNPSQIAHMAKMNALRHANGAAA